ncbi:MAG TPA: diacylglycerol kinase family lipid kinase [Candidatus Merdivicinus intestinavium]|nr:diacylglycerol kinase family lipid kinase [Candidatus Merdivicinus intestinavium]
MLLTANIHAGKGTVGNRLPGVIDYYVSQGWDVTVHTTQGRSELVDYLTENACGYEMLVSSGGDGTLNETINGLMACSAPPILSYLPAGTVNDFASSLKIPKDMAEAARLLENGVPRRVDLGLFGEQYFSYVAAFGAFTDVAYQTPQAAKQVWGRLAYLVEGVKRLPSLRSYHMKLSADGFELEDDFLYGMVSNSTSVGGFRFHEQLGVSMDDGVLELALVRFPKNLSEQQAVINALLKQEAVPGLVYLRRVSHLHIVSEVPVPWTLDGEFGGEVQELDVRCCPQALEILVPGEEPKADAQA